MLHQKHKPNDDNTTSHFLLSKTGLTGKKVQKNRKGTTRNLSFRDVARFVIIVEENIIAERSPVITATRTNNTAERSTFRLLITGLDDSSVVDQSTTEITRRKQQGKKELLEELIEKSELEIAALTDEEISDEILAQMVIAAETAVQEMSKALSDQTESAETLERKRLHALESLQRLQSQTTSLVELQHRFTLLKSHYISDVERLSAISEAGHLLAHMTEQSCPICGAIPEHHNTEHLSQNTQLEDVVDACAAEQQKIQTLLKELNVTLNTNKQKLSELQRESEQNSEQLGAAETKLREELQPQIKELVISLREAEQRRARATQL